MAFVEIKKSVVDLFSNPRQIPGVLTAPYYPILDGLRGVAIIMVVLFHCHLSDNFFYQIIFSGKLGVDIFFVLSGFLITTLILKEKITTLTVSLKRFYIRRAFRILPVAYLYILVSLCLNYVFHTHVSYLIFVASALFIMDFSFFKWFNDPYTGHYWSLSVEEQFYILFPILLKKSWRLYLITILLLLFVLPITITAEFLFFPTQLKALYYLTHFFIKFQGIATGCFFSLLCFKFNWNNGRVLALRYILNPLIIALILLLRFDDFLTIGSMFKDLLISMLVAYLIVINLYPGKGVFHRFLSSKLLRKIGMLSYSIYIWQQIFTIKSADIPSWFWQPPYNIISIIVISCLSYFFFERYFLKLKNKFSINKTKPVA
jgi:peptidoglycan/LPS O-acetylase OafA/YrhL